MRILAPLAVAVLLAAGCATPKMTHGIPNLDEVERGIWRGGQPTDEGWRWLVSAGVNRVVKLNPPNEADDTVARLLGLEVLDLPISLTAQITGVPSPARLDAAVAAIQPGTFIHCTHGEDRTGLVLGLWRVRECGWTKRRAHAEMLDHGFHPLLRGLEWAWETEPEHPGAHDFSPTNPR